MILRRTEIICVGCPSSSEGFRVFRDLGNFSEGNQLLVNAEGRVGVGVDPKP